MPKKEKAASSSWSLSQSWFVYVNLALVIVAFAMLYQYLPARAALTAPRRAYNASLLAAPMLRADGEIWHTIRVVTDLDQDSRVENAKRPTWRSILKSGVLKIAADGESARVDWNDAADVELRCEFALGGRVCSPLGALFSILVSL